MNIIFQDLLSLFPVIRSKHQKAKKLLLQFISIHLKALCTFPDRYQFIYGTEPVLHKIFQDHFVILSTSVDIWCKGKQFIVFFHLTPCQHPASQFQLTLYADSFISIFGDNGHCLLIQSPGDQHLQKSSSVYSRILLIIHLPQIIICFFCPDMFRIIRKQFFSDAFLIFIWKFLWLRDSLECLKILLIWFRMFAAVKHQPRLFYMKIKNLVCQFTLIK